MNLVKAAARNEILSVRLLLENGADADGRYPWSTLYTPCPLFQTPSGQLDRNRPSDIIEPVLYEAGPLHVAAMAGHYEIVCLLVEAGANALGRDGMGRTPLTCSIYGLDTLTITAANLAYISQSHPAHLSILRLLAGLPALKNRPFDPTPESSSNRRLTLSSRHKLDGDRGPIDHPQEEIKGITPLCLAAYLGKEAVVKALLQEGLARVNATDQNGATALMYAARDGHLGVVRILLAHDASPDITDDNGWSAIQYGQMYPEIVRLFERGLRAARPRVVELLPFAEIAMSYPRIYPELYACLKKFPEPPMLTAMNDDSDPQKTHVALVDAIKEHDYQTIQSIILSGRSGRPASEKFALIINSHDHSTGMSPLHHAVKAKPAPSLDTIVAIYQSGVDINVQTHYGRSALHHLCRLKAEYSTKNGDELASTGTENMPRPTAQHLARCASLLIRFGALLSVGDRHGNTPLHFAAEVGGCIAVVKTLVQAGADTEKKNGKGLLPREVAKNSEIKKYLEAHAANSRIPDAVLEAVKADSGSLDSSSVNSRRRSSWQHRQMEKSAIQARENRGIVQEHLRSQMTRNPRQPEQGSVQRHFSVMPENTDPLQGYVSRRGSVQRTASNASTSSDIRRLSRMGNATDSFIAAASARRSSYQADQGDLLGRTAGSSYEAELNFHQVIENLEYYHSNAAPSIEHTLSIITQKLSRAMQLATPEDGNVTDHQRSIQILHTREVRASAAQLRGDLQLTYQLITVTEGQHRDVVSWQKAELDAANAVYEILLEKESFERMRLAELNKLHARLTQDVNRLLDENASVKKKIERQRKQVQGKLAAIVSSLQTGQTENRRLILGHLETIDDSGDVTVSGLEESERTGGDSSIAASESATVVEIGKSESSRTAMFLSRIEQLETAMKSENGSSLPEGIMSVENGQPSSGAVPDTTPTQALQDESSDGQKAEQASMADSNDEKSRTVADELSTGAAAEEETVESLELQMAILTANLEEITCDIAEQDAAISLILRDMKAVHMRCLEFDRSAGEIFTDSNTGEIQGLMVMAGELHENHKAMVYERRRLELERERAEKERETVQVALRKKSPRDLLNGLLGTLDVRHPTRQVKMTSPVPQVQEDHDISHQLVDAKLIIQILESTLFSLEALSTRKIEGLFYNLAESRNCLDGAENELTICEVNVSNIAYEIRALRDAVGAIQREVEGIIKHRKDEVENVWDLVYDLSGGGRRLSIESNGTQHSFTSAASAAAARRSPILMGVVEEEEDEFMDEDEATTRREQHGQRRAETNAAVSAKAAEATAAVGATGAGFRGDGNERFLLDLDRLLAAHGAVLSRIVALRQAVADANRQRLLVVRQAIDSERLRLLGDHGRNGLASEAKGVYDYLLSLSDALSDAGEKWTSTDRARRPYRKEYHLLYPETTLNPVDAARVAERNGECKMAGQAQDETETEERDVFKHVKTRQKHKRSFSDSTATYTTPYVKKEKTVISTRVRTEESARGSQVRGRTVEVRPIEPFNRPHPEIMTRKRCSSLQHRGSARISVDSRPRRHSWELTGPLPRVVLEMIARAPQSTNVVATSLKNDVGAGHCAPPFAPKDDHPQPIR